MRQLSFSSNLKASADEVWRHATSMAGVNQELAPMTRMTFPARFAELGKDLPPTGEPLWKSWILAWGIIPIDVWDITFESFQGAPERRFVETSRTLSLSRWRHERRVERRESGCRVVDDLTLAPRVPGTGAILERFVRATFVRRHAFLQSRFG